MKVLLQKNLKIKKKKKKKGVEDQQRPPIVDADDRLLASTFNVNVVDGLLASTFVDTNALTDRVEQIQQVLTTNRVPTATDRH
jgi:hypothetical protein